MFERFSIPFFINHKPFFGLLIHLRFWHMREKEPTNVVKLILYNTFDKPLSFLSPPRLCLVIYNQKVAMLI